MNSYSLLSGITTFVCFSGVTRSQPHDGNNDYSWLNNCDADCWIRTVAENYEGLTEIYNNEDIKELVVSIEDWYEVSYLYHYMNEMEWGKKFNALNAKDVEATRRWGQHEEMLAALGEQGHTFDDYQKEKIKLLGNVGKKYATKHYGHYNNLDDLDLSFKNYISTFHRDECGTDCASFLEQIQPYFVSSLFDSVLNNMGVSLSIGYTFDIIAWHRGYGIGIGANGYLNRLALFESSQVGKHLLGVGVSSSLDVSLFSDFDNMPGESNYLGISGGTEGLEYDIGASIITSGGQLIGISAGVSDGLGVGTPISIAWGDDVTTFIYSTDDAQKYINYNNNNKNNKNKNKDVESQAWPFGPEPTDDGKVNAQRWPFGTDAKGVNSNRWPFGTDAKGVNSNRWPFGTDAKGIHSNRWPFGTDANNNENKEMNDKAFAIFGNEENQDFAVKIALLGVIALMVSALFVYYSKSNKNSKYISIPEDAARERRPLVY